MSAEKLYPNRPLRSGGQKHAIIYGINVQGMCLDVASFNFFLGCSVHDLIFWGTKDM